MIKKVLKISSKGNSTILDFFAGSGTTGQAVLELNKEDKGKRKFILCTNNDLNGIGSNLAEKSQDNMKEKFGICQRVTYPRIEKIIKGYNKNGDGEWIDGFGGNLKYYTTNFVKKTRSRDQVSFQLTNKCTEMLCLKENIFNLHIENKDYKVFQSNKRDKFLCIYYNLKNSSFDNFIEELKKIKEEKIIYMFSFDNFVDEEWFKDIKNFTIEAIPESIITLYQYLYRLSQRHE